MLITMINIQMCSVGGKDATQVNTKEKHGANILLPISNNARDNTWALG